MLEVFYEVRDLLRQQVELSKKMEEHLYKLTLPPNMVAWAKKIQNKREVDKE